MTKKEVDKAYEDLKKQGQATVENIVEWMKQAKVLEKAQKTEEEAANMFAAAKSNAQVTEEKFAQVIQDMATSAKVSHEQMYQQLSEASSRFISALSQAAAAFSSTMMESPPTTSKK